jgi:excisionase family DNA binding protein
MTALESTLQSLPVAPEASAAAGSVGSLENAVSAALKTVRLARQKHLAPSVSGHEYTVRIRPKGGPDRRFSLTCAIDPDDDETLVFRLRPMSDRDWDPARTSLLSTQQAAGQLNVSRPYVVKLVEDGVFQGVERTRAGHRRIPAAEVERVRQDMQTSRRVALSRMEALDADAGAKELAAARASVKRRWVKTGAS